MRSLFFISILSFVTSFASATELTIIAPANESEIVLSPKPITVNYQAKFDGDDHHLFIYLNDRQVQKLRAKFSSYTFDQKMPLGNNKICLKVAYEDDLLTGQQKCIKIKFLAPRHVNYGNSFDD